MTYTLMTLVENNTAFVLERTKPANNCREKLNTYILSSLEYQGRHREYVNALLEIVFNARTPENIPYYKLNDNEEEPLVFQLQHILSSGQKSGEFQEFNTLVMARAIQGAIGEYMANPNLSAKIDTTASGLELTRIFERAVLNDRKNDDPFT